MRINQSVNDEANWLAILLLANCFAAAFWIVSQNIDVYRYAIVGAIFEFLWLPVIATLLLIPLVSLYFWYKEKFKEKFKEKSKYLYLLGFYVLSIILIFLVI